MNMAAINALILLVISMTLALISLSRAANLLVSVVWPLIAFRPHRVHLSLSLWGV